MNKTESPRVPDLRVEQLALGALSPEEAAKTRAQLAAEPGGLQRLSALAEDDDAIRARYPAAAVGAEVKRRLNRRLAPKLALGLVPLAATAAAIVLLMRPAPQVVFVMEGADFGTERAKGPLLPGLAIHRQIAEAAELLGRGAPVKPGDVLQLTATPRGAGHGVIISIDGRGATTIHFPDGAGASTALPAGLASVALSHAYELDDAPVFERFFLVTAHHPIEVATVEAAARALVARGEAALTEPLSLPTDHAQADFLLRKPQ